MDDFRKIKPSKESKPATEKKDKEPEEQTVEDEKSMDEVFSYSSTDTSFDLSEHSRLLDTCETTDKYLGLPPSPISIDEEEEVGEEGESSATEIFSDQSELSVWEKDVQEIQEAEESLTEELTEEQISGTKVEIVEDEIEQTTGGMEEMEKEESEEEEEEEQLDEESSQALERERRIAEFQKDLEEILSFEFPEDNETEEMKLVMYKNRVKELDKEEKEIDQMLIELEKNDNTIQKVAKALDPLITYYEKQVSAFQEAEKLLKDFVGDHDGEGEEEEDVEDECRSRAAEMAQEILEADEIESVGSLGKMSSDSDLSAILSQLAAELKESEPELENEEESVSNKASRKKKKKGQQRKESKQKTTTGKKSK